MHENRAWAGGLQSLQNWTARTLAQSPAGVASRIGNSLLQTLRAPYSLSALGCENEERKFQR